MIKISLIEKYSILLKLQLSCFMKISLKVELYGFCIALYIPPKSIFDFIGAGVILPIIVYTITLSVFFINIIQVVKEEKAKKTINY